MKWVTFVESADKPRRVGFLLNGESDILDLTNDAVGIEAPARFNQWFDADAPCHIRARALYERLADDPAGLTILAQQRALISATQALLLAPIPRPGKLIGIEGTKENPVLYSKYSSSVVGPSGPVVLPRIVNEAASRAELGLVIGRRGYRIPVADAMDHVLGYTNINCITAPELESADGQWQRARSCDTFTPMGRFIATKDEIQDPKDLDIQLRVNGEVQQRGHTSRLLLSIPEFIHYASETATLEPGDVLTTGTSFESGGAENPSPHGGKIEDNDRLEVEITGLGILENPVIRRTQAADS